MYTCMLVHVYLGGLLNDDHHSDPIKADFFNFSIFFFYPGGRWQSGALYLYMHCTQAVPDNVYLISSKGKGS